MHVSLATEAAPGRDGGVAGGDRGAEFVAATSDAIVLLDGTGPGPGEDSGCSHGVPWYVRSLGAVLLSELSQPSWPLPRILSRAIKHVTSLHDFTCDLSRPGAPAASVVMTRRTRDALEYLVLADAVIVLDVGAPEPLVIRDRHAPPDPAGEAVAQTVGAVAARYGPAAAPAAPDAPGAPAAPGPSHPPAAQAGAPHGHHGSHQDAHHDPWTACTDPLAADRALTGSVPLDQVRAVALLSVGASRLIDAFRLTSWRHLLALLGRHGAREAIRQMRAAEQLGLAACHRPYPARDASIAYWEPS